MKEKEIIMASVLLLYMENGSREALAHAPDCAPFSFAHR